MIEWLKSVFAVVIIIVLALGFGAGLWLGVESQELRYTTMYKCEKLPE